MRRAKYALLFALEEMLMEDKKLEEDRTKEENTIGQTFMRLCEVIGEFGVMVKELLEGLED
jgi:hypothetical protein